MQDTVSPCGTATSYIDTGAGRVVVLLHGVGLSKEMWRAQIAALQSDFRVIALDMLGHGDSAPPPPDASLEDYADQVADLLDALGVEHASLVGFSMGALVARAFALRHGARLDTLVLLSGVFNRSSVERASILTRVEAVATHGPGANVEAALERWYSQSYRAAHPDEMEAVRRQMAGNDPASYALAYRLFATQDDYGGADLARITAPTLVATGELDVGSTPDMARRLAQQIPGAELNIIAGGRHMIPREMPDAINYLLLNYLGQMQARSFAR